MTIKEFIQNEVLLPRLREHCVLIVYDPARRYREVCLELSTESRRVVDTGESSVEGREEAIRTLQGLGEPDAETAEMIVYVPARKPLSDEDKQRDPYSVYSACGALFPDGAGDEYDQLCLKAKADQTTEIRRIFLENPNPSFEVIDAVAGGSGWPSLQAILKVESARDILFALLAPSDKQKEALKAQETWASEAKALFLTSLGLKLVTRGKTWSAVADELWRFMLFSEFCFDLPGELLPGELLPGELPEALSDVPHATPEAKPLVEDLCDRLRSDRRTQAVYIERAEGVEEELNLGVSCEGILDLGARDTFPFEERSSLVLAVEALKHGDIENVRAVLNGHARSVWVGKGENQAQWLLLEAAFDLIQSCDDAEPQLSIRASSQEMLLDFYTVNLREVDRLHREFEQATSDFVDGGGQISAVITQARDAYRCLMAKVQDLFIRHLEESGWPPAGRLANADVFDRHVAPKLQESGKRVAYLLIDALRYELGVELEKQLSEDGQVQLYAGFVSLPSITTVGMASLLPDAGQKLKLIREDGRMVPVLGEQPLTTVTQRMDVLRKRFGERFSEATLHDFLKGKAAPAGSVELFVLRSATIDSQLESTPELALKVIQNSLKAIRAAIHKLRDQKFHEVVIATDHGFFLNTVAGPGDVCSKPQGNWLTIHERVLLGDGVADAANFVLPAERLGVRGDFNQVAGPRAIVAYRAGESYFHGGASLQETIVPVIVMRLEAKEEKVPRRLKVTLTHRGGAKRVTTRLPVIGLTVTGEDLFSTGSAVTVLLEAYDKKGNVVGEAKPGGFVNPATRTISVAFGDTVQVPLKMSLEFEGKFTVKALDPITLTTYSKLDLETDYTV